MNLPFHETIVTAIKHCPNTTAIIPLLDLIRVTEIPDNHDEISKAIDIFFAFPGGSKWAKEINNVKANIAEKKRRTEEIKSSPAGIIRRTVEDIIVLIKEGGEVEKFALIQRRFAQLDASWGKLMNQGL